MTTNKRMPELSSKPVLNPEIAALFSGLGSKLKSAASEKVSSTSTITFVLILILIITIGTLIYYFKKQRLLETQIIILVKVQSVITVDCN